MIEHQQNDIFAQLYIRVDQNDTNIAHKNYNYNSCLDWLMLNQDETFMYVLMFDDLNFGISVHLLVENITNFTTEYFLNFPLLYWSNKICGMTTSQESPSVVYVSGTSQSTSQGMVWKFNHTSNAVGSSSWIEFGGINVPYKIINTAGSDIFVISNDMDPITKDIATYFNMNFDSKTLKYSNQIYDNTRVIPDLTTPIIAYDEINDVIYTMFVFDSGNFAIFFDTDNGSGNNTFKYVFSDYSAWLSMRYYPNFVYMLCHKKTTRYSHIIIYSVDGQTFGTLQSTDYLAFCLSIESAYNRLFIGMRISDPLNPYVSLTPLSYLEHQSQLSPTSINITDVSGTSFNYIIETTYFGPTSDNSNSFNNISLTFDTNFTIPLGNISHVYYDNRPISIGIFQNGIESLSGDLSWVIEGPFTMTSRVVHPGTISPFLTIDYNTFFMTIDTLNYDVEVNATYTFYSYSQYRSKTYLKQISLIVQECSLSNWFSWATTAAWRTCEDNYTLDSNSLCVIPNTAVQDSSNGTDTANSTASNPTSSDSLSSNEKLAILVSLITIFTISIL